MSTAPPWSSSGDPAYRVLPKNPLEPHLQDTPPPVPFLCLHHAHPGMNQPKANPQSWGEASLSGAAQRTGKFLGFLCRPHAPSEGLLASDSQSPADIRQHTRPAWKRAEVEPCGGCRARPSQRGSPGAGHSPGASAARMRAFFPAGSPAQSSSAKCRVHTGVGGSQAVSQGAEQTPDPCR